MNWPFSLTRFSWTFGIVFVLGIFLAPLGATAQTASSFSLTSAVLQCDDSVLALAWSGDGSIASLTISISNTSSNWADEVVLISPTGNSYSYAFDHHAIDKVVVKAVINGIVPFVYQYQADIGNCGVPGTISGGLLGEDEGNPDIPISIIDATCTGFSWTVSSPTEVRVYVSVVDTIGQGMIPFVPVNGTDLSRTETYQVTNENQTHFNISIWVHDAQTNEELARKSLSKQCPIAMETPPVTPGVTPSVTPDVDERTRVVIQIEMPGGASIEGASYSLFAPMAAQFAAEPYVQGTVGPNNTIVLFDLIEGQYRLVIEPVGMDPIDVVFSIGADQVTELMVVVDADGNASVVPGQIAPTSTAAPADAEAPATSGGASSGDGVSNLPSTGSGGAQASTPMLLFVLATALMGIVSLAVVRKSAMNR